MGLTFLLSSLGFLLLLPCSLLWLESMATLLRDRSPAVFDPLIYPQNQRTFRLAILMPAHNEAAGITATLQNLLPQINAADTLLVVADNCTDATATLARQAGATVIERKNQNQRGKGYALAAGMEALKTDPPEIIVIVDADCIVEAPGIEHLAQLAFARQRPVQGNYLMERPPQPTIKDLLSSFAFLVKNLVRPLGLARLGQPCLLTGTGMAFPWFILEQAPLATGNIVEDMQLGIDLAIAGNAPLYCVEAKIVGILPSQAQSATQQRTRWEHGHLQTLLKTVPLLLREAIFQRRGDLLMLAGEVSIPPLSLLVLIWIVFGLAAVLAYGLLGITLPLILALISGLAIAWAIGLAWWQFARDWLPFQTLFKIPLYLLWKIPLYFAFLNKPQQEWVRTDREKLPKS